MAANDRIVVTCKSKESANTAQSGGRRPALAMLKNRHVEMPPRNHDNLPV